MMMQDIVGLSVLFLMLATIMSYLFIKVRMTYLFKFILIPATLGLALLTGVTFNNVFGYAKNGFPEHKFVVLFYTPYRNTEGEVKIDLLVKEQGRRRLYCIPYSRETERKLQWMMEGKGLRFGDFEDDELSTQEVPMEQILRKQLSDDTNPVE